ncbi:MAG: 50S ribosomal protein L9 [Ignavibacteriales bacterium CG07_land_8_20_14_0_80_59_12]|nr:MAG: 50S ribosomal protein L9 [Ignavibacteriales bacterium CG07_land_8_20_14_0_80_59_12]
MKAILRKDYESLGRIGDAVDVKDGYGRNFLIPRGIAYEARPGNLRALEEEKRQLAVRESKSLKAAERLSSELEKVSITILMKVGEEEKLFGSVTAQNVAEALKEKGYSIEKQQIEIEEPIKALGIYTVNVKLHHAVAAKVKVWVVAE